MYKLIAFSLVVSAIAVTVYSQTGPAPTIQVEHSSQLDGTRGITTIYFTTPLESDPTRVVRLQTVVTPAGGSNGFHRHPGDQWATVEEGEVTLTIKSEVPVVLKAGDSVHIPRGAVHRNQNLSNKPARSIEVVIFDKDKPITEAVPN